MIKKEKYKMVFKSHDGEWNTHSFYDHKECVAYKDKLLDAYACSDIKIFHYDLSDKVGIAQCVFNAIGLIDISKEVYA